MKLIPALQLGDKASLRTRAGKENLSETIKIAFYLELLFVFLMEPGDFFFSFFTRMENNGWWKTTPLLVVASERNNKKSQFLRGGKRKKRFYRSTCEMWGRRQLRLIRGLLSSVNIFFSKQNSKGFHFHRHLHGVEGTCTALFSLIIKLKPRSFIISQMFSLFVSFGKVNICSNHG